MEVIKTNTTAQTIKNNTSTKMVIHMQIAQIVCGEALNDFLDKPKLWLANQM